MPNTWTFLSNIASGTTQTRIYYRRINGTEGFTGVDDFVSIIYQTYSSGVGYEHAMLPFSVIIRNAHITSNPAVSTSTPSIPDPPSLTASWGAENNLWLTFVAVVSGSSIPITGVPTNYTSYGTDSAHPSTSGSAYYSHAFAARQKLAATENPSGFTGSPGNYTAATIAIRPESFIGEFGIYYYETSDDGITWTTRYTENATAYSPEGKFQITATRTAGSGNDTVAFDNFYLIKNSRAPTVIIKVTCPATGATASVTAPTTTGASTNQTITSIPATAIASVDSPVITHPGSIPVPPAIASASIHTFVADVTIYQVVAEATASVDTPIVNTFDNATVLDPKSASAIASSSLAASTVIIYEVVASATASVSTPTIDNPYTDPIVLAQPARATANRISFIKANATATASIPTVTLIVKIISSAASSTASSVGQHLYPIHPRAANAIASSSPSPRITITVVSRATASVSTPVVISTTGHSVTVPVAQATANQITLPYDVVYSVVASSTASVTAPVIRVIVSAVSNSTASVSTPTLLITVISVAQATASVTAPSLAGSPNLSAPAASATASVSVPTISIPGPTTTDMLAFPEDATDMMWAGNISLFDNEMPHTDEEDDMALLYDTTLAVDTANFDITSISSTYKHLLLFITMTGTDGGTQTGARVRFNNDSGSNYAYHGPYYSSDGSQSGAFNSNSQTSINIGLAPAAGNTAGAYAAAVVHISNYASTSTQKHLFSQNFSGPCDSSNRDYTTNINGIWRSTAAINQITVYPHVGNWKSTSRITLFGLK